MTKKILVTSALPYVNNIPHLGNLIPIISADVYSRFRKLKRDNCIFVCGTDEHGTTAEIKAKEEGCTPKELVDKYFKIHKEIYQWFNFDIDCFGRTSDPSNHEISKDIFVKLYQNGFIIEQTLIQMWDDSEKRFLSDRFIIGTCPHCKFEHARGDQCDNCGKLLDPIDLINPKSEISGTTPIQKESKHLFIDLSKIENNKNLDPDLTEWIEQNKKTWTHNALTTTKGWIKEGLKPRCITRDLSWGVPIPVEETKLSEEYSKKVFYSWFDAPIGYISITANHTHINGSNTNIDWKDWWKNQKETNLVQFMGKDNIPFHTILFPAFCIGAKDNYTLMNEISVNEYINYEKGKFSKSRQQGVFGDDAKNSNIPADVYRYYLMAMRPEKEDTDFEWEGFQIKNNKELLGNLGNLVNRVLTFVKNNFDGFIYDSPEYKSLEQNPDFKDIEKSYISIKLKEALIQIMKVSSDANVYFQSTEPWVSVKSNPEKTKKDIAILARRVKDLAILIHPYMPTVSQEILKQLNLDYEWLYWDKLLEPLPKNHKIGTPKVLFKKMEDEFIKEMKEKYSGKKEFPLNLKVAKIISAKKHPDAESLLVLEIDLGSEKRQLVAGLQKHYSPDELIDKKIIVLTNLKPAKLRGIESQGMLLAGVDKDAVKILSPEKSNVGDQVYFENKNISKKEIDFEEFKKFNIVIKNNKIFLDKNSLKTDSEEIQSSLEKGKVY